MVGKVRGEEVNKRRENRSFQEVILQIHNFHEYWCDGKGISNSQTHSLELSKKKNNLECEKFFVRKYEICPQKWVIKALRVHCTTVAIEQVMS